MVRRASRPAALPPRVFRWSIRFRLWQYTRGSLWVLPLVALVTGMLLARVSTAVDQAVQVPESFRYSSSTATTVLTTVVAAMIGLLGLVVTIGVLVVQQATSALSPRFMRLWYDQHLQKWVLATFAGTFAFAYALHRPRGPDPGKPERPTGDPRSP